MSSLHSLLLPMTTRKSRPTNHLTLAIARSGLSVSESFSNLRIERSGTSLLVSMEIKQTDHITTLLSMASLNSKPIDLNIYGLMASPMLETLPLNPPNTLPVTQRKK